jgi:hypothetical protein
VAPPRQFSAYVLFLCEKVHCVLTFRDVILLLIWN